jgi:hypothetical protein
MGRYHFHSALGVKQTGNFQFANFAGSDNQTSPPFEFQEKWE